MLPTNSKAWTFIIVACLIGFVIGQWLKARKDKVEKNKNAYLNSLKMMALAETRAQTKKAKRKKRKANKQAAE
jgi:Na+/glutamate symporter